MPDLKTQLADYFDHVVQRVDVSEIIGDCHAGREHSGAPPQFEADKRRGDDLTFFIVPQPGERTVQRERRRWIGVAAAVAATILVVAGFLVVADGDGLEAETDSVPSSSATDPVASSVTEPSAVPNVASLGWEIRWSRVPHSEASSVRVSSRR
jgi:hypothetical protein